MAQSPPSQLAGLICKRKTRWGPPVTPPVPVLAPTPRKQFSDDTPKKLFLRILRAHPKAGEGARGRGDSFCEKITRWYQDACEIPVGRPARNYRIYQLRKKAAYCESVEMRKRDMERLGKHHMELIAKHEAAMDRAGRKVKARVTKPPPRERPPSPQTPPADVDEACQLERVYGHYGLTHVQQPQYKVVGRYRR